MQIKSKEKLKRKARKKLKSIIALIEELFVENALLRGQMEAADFVASNKTSDPADASGSTPPQSISEPTVKLKPRGRPRKNPLDPKVRTGPPKPRAMVRRGRPPQSGYPNIRRVEIRKEDGRRETRGWQFHHRQDGVSQTKFFSDALHGGKEAALDKAVAYRSEYFQIQAD